MTGALRGRAGPAIALACVAAAVVLGIAEASFQRASSSLGNLAARGQARSAVQLVMRRILDAETAQRGFLITGRQEYLVPFKEVNSDVAQSMAQLRAHYANDPALAATVEELSKRTLEKLSEISETISLYERGQHTVWRDLIMTDIGREKMEAVRALAEILLATEDRRVGDERADVFKTLYDGRIGVRVMTLLCLLILAIYLHNMASWQRAQDSHAAALKGERDLLETEVQQRTAELTELARHLQTAREDERGRLARELHDELGALLTAAKLDAARMKRAIGTSVPELSERLEHLVTALDQGISLKRRIIEDLRPSSLSNLGLCAALEIQAREFEQRSGLQVVAQIEEANLSEEAQIVVYRVAQETFTNIAKHAMARRVELSLQAQGDRSVLRIVDDGQGFDPAGLALGAHGLLGMRYRVESVGGGFRVSSAKGRGTTIECWVPSHSTLSAPCLTTSSSESATARPTKTAF